MKIEFRIAASALALFVASAGCSVASQSVLARDVVSESLVLRHSYLLRGYVERRDCESSPWGGVETQAAIAAARPPAGTLLFVENGTTFVRGEVTITPKRLPRIRQQAIVVADVLAKLGARVVTPGVPDLWLGLPTLQELERRVPFVVSNATYRGKAPFPISRKLATPLGEVCFVGAMDAELTSGAAPKGWKIVPEVEALTKAIAACGTSFTVALVDFPASKVRTLAEKVPGVSLWLGGEGRHSGIPPEVSLAPSTYSVSAGPFGEQWADLTFSRLPNAGEPWVLRQDRAYGEGIVVDLARTLIHPDPALPVPAWATELLRRWQAAKP